MLLKLVIWDLDDTLVEGVFAEGDRTCRARAVDLMNRLEQGGILQALATQNEPEAAAEALTAFDWSRHFVEVAADFGRKADKLCRILARVDVHASHVAYVDDDPFERDALRVQVPEVSAWSVSELADYLDRAAPPRTPEARQRPRMHREQQTRDCSEERYGDYEDFLRACNIQLLVRPYRPEDAERVEELLSRTHRMNLGALPVEAAMRLAQRQPQHVLVAEVRDRYGELGRSGVLFLSARGDDEATVESLAISCRTKARGLSLALLMGLLRHPAAAFRRYRTRFVATGRNRPLRMLLLAAGFHPARGTDELVLEAEHGRRKELPEWVHCRFDVGDSGETREAS